VCKFESILKSSQSASFHRHCITIFTGKCQAIGKLVDRRAFLEHLQAKRIHGRKVACMNKNFADVSVLSFEDVYQLVCGRTVEITHEFKVKVVTVSMKKDTEI